MEASFKLISEYSKSCNVKFYILIYNKTHGIIESNRSGVLKAIFKINLKD